MLPLKAGPLPAGPLPIAQTLSARVEEAIKKVLAGEADALDGPTFDAVAYTNAAFPDDRASSRWT